MDQSFDPLPNFATVLTEGEEHRRAAAVRSALQVVNEVLNPVALAPRLAAGEFAAVQQDLLERNIRVGKALFDGDVRSFTRDEERLLSRVMVTTYTERVEDLPELLLITAGSVHRFLEDTEPRT